MPPSKARYVTICQQLLAIAAVIAVLAPAANVLSLDVIASGPTPSATSPEAPADSAESAESSTPGTAKSTARKQRAAEPTAPAAPKARVETAPVEAEVAEVPMSPVAKPVDVPMPKADAAHEHDQEAPSRRQAEETDDTAAGDEEAPAGGVGIVVESAPETVHGYGAVGVTWSADSAALAEGEIAVQVRTNTDGTWSKWVDVEYHDHDGPDADSAEGRNARPGTDAMFVGEVDQVQARALTADGVALPKDIKLAVIAPGTSAGTELERPAIDTNKLATGGKDAGSTADAETDAADESNTPPAEDETLESSEGDLELSKSAFTQKPQIFSRAQWGANEKLRDGSPSYNEVHAGFVHHTVNANNYTKAQVPAMIRSIYAYHTQTRGWSDVGYNFLVDRFGRIWEGRYGGVDRPVVGAHTLGYNENSFAMSAIGNFDVTKPSEAMVQAYGNLMAWKLALHGVKAGSTSQSVSGKTFKAINGHRDAGSTACPGRYLYARIPDIRKIAVDHQADWSGRDRATDIVSTSYPDLLLRRTDGKVYAVPTAGMLKWKTPTTSAGWGAYDTVVASPDLTGDGKGDLLVRNSTGASAVRPGLGNGNFGGSIKVSRKFAGLDQITAVGDLNGDGKNDLVARNPKTGKLVGMWGKGDGSIKSMVSLSTAWAGYDLTAATGDVDGDGHADLLARDKAGKLWLHRGTGKGALRSRVAVSGSWSGYDVITGFGDFNGDGKADLYVRDARTKSATIRPGSGTGSFLRSLGGWSNIKSGSMISAAQVNGTSHPDLVQIVGEKLSVVTHNGTRNFATPIYLGSGFNGADQLLNVGDWDRDGFNDVVTVTTAGELRLHRGLGKNKFAAPTTLHTGFKNVKLLAAVGDVTGDGRPDLMGQPSGGSMRIYPGKSAGLLPSYVAKGALPGNLQLGLGRWNADGAPDVALRDGSVVRWYRGNGPGGLTGGASTISLNLSGYDLVVSPGDVDRDGRPDLVVRDKGGESMYLLPGTASGFGPRVFLGQGFRGYDRAG